MNSKEHIQAPATRNDEAAAKAASPTSKTQRDFDLEPVTCELFADELTPLMVLRRLQNVSRHCYLLESVENSTEGRYTFLGFDPSMEITCKNGHMRITAKDESELAGLAGTTAASKVTASESETATDKFVLEFDTTDPNPAIRAILARHKSSRKKELPPFTGGLVGYFSYDYLKYAEPTLRLDAPDEEGFNDIDLMLFDKVIAFDNLKKKLILIANARTEQGEAGIADAKAELAAMKNVVLNGSPAPRQGGKVTSEFRQLFDEQGFCDVVNQAKKRIHEGDIFQVVLSNRLDADFEGSLLDTYRVMRTTNPSPYLFFLASDDIEMAGASPETLVKLEGDTLRTFPLAGTRPRGATPEEDARIEAELLADEKELAEHNMLVDLGRNDIGKLSRYGTVKVENYLSIQRFSHVMHIGSTVSGQIAPDKDALDALSSVLPAGTLSGAPKLSACQIINDLERCKRGVYGGAIGYLDFAGNMDMCIAIRLVFKKNGRVFVRSGAGIVADSVPENEYRETINKAAAVRLALETAQGGLDS